MLPTNVYNRRLRKYNLIIKSETIRGKFLKGIFSTMKNDYLIRPKYDSIHFNTSSNIPYFECINANNTIDITSVA